MIVFEIPNEREIAVVYEENPMSLKYIEWKKMFDYAVAGEYSFLFINYQKPKGLRCMRNFDQVLFFSDPQ